MPDGKKVKDLMIPLEDYPHVPYWFTLRQAMAIVREAAIKFEGFMPRSVLVFDEKYQLLGMLTLRDIIKGLEPRFLKETEAIPAEEFFTPRLKEASQRTIGEVMSPIKVTVNADDSLTRALSVMITENVGMMPVMQNNKVVGMIRLSDLFKVISDYVLGE